MIRHIDCDNLRNFKQIMQMLLYHSVQLDGFYESALASVVQNYTEIITFMNQVIQNYFIFYLQDAFLKHLAHHWLSVLAVQMARGKRGFWERDDRAE